MVDQDGTAYLIYTSESPGPGLGNHRVSIEKLAPDFLSSTQENYGLFPESYVEVSGQLEEDSCFHVVLAASICITRALYCFGVTNTIM